MPNQNKYLFLNCLIILCLFCLILADSSKTFAQCENALSITGARGIEGNNFVFVSFNFNTNWNSTHKDLVDEARNAANWSIFSPTLLQKAKAAPDPSTKNILFIAATPDIETVALSGNRALKITFSDTLRKGETYMFNITSDNNLIPTECIGNPLPVTVSLPPQQSSSGGVGGQTSDADNKKFFIAEVEKRYDADVYVEGIAEGAKKTKTAFTVDASIGRRILFKKGEPDYFWKPFFNIKASTKEDADPNSLNFGVNFENPTGLLSKNIFRINRLYFTEAAKFEADRNFKNVNFVGDFRMKIDTRILNRELFGIPFNIIPFIGIEVGKNLKSPVKEIKGKLIARPLFGANLYARLYTFSETTGYKKAIIFETLYERRFLLKKEIALGTDEDENFISVPLTRAPRDYVKSSLTYDFAKNFGFKLNYEYGSLPPLFKLVDSKFSVGLVFKGIFDKK